MIDALFIEIDGILADTRRARRESVLAAITAVCQAPMELDDINADDVFDGRPTAQTARALLARSGVATDQVAHDLIAREADVMFSASLAQGVLLHQGARAFLDRLSGQTRLAAVTGLRRSVADSLLRLAGLEPIFELVITADDVIDPKPSPEGYLAALTRLGRRRPVSADHVIALEPSRTGVRAARAAGVRCVATGDMAPQHAMEAEGYIASLEGVSLSDIVVLAGRNAKAGEP